jgi:hypothetical protein
VLGCCGLDSRKGIALQVAPIEPYGCGILPTRLNRTMSRPLKGSPLLNKSMHAYMSGFACTSTLMALS